jgi:hypothetical protein
VGVTLLGTYILVIFWLVPLFVAASTLGTLNTGIINSSREVMVSTRGQYYKTFFHGIYEWKGINRKQSTRWQHLSQLKASGFFSLQKKLVVMKHSNLYLGLVLPSGG